MATAIDTNVLVALFTGTGENALQARIALRQVEYQGELVIAAPVYAEILATFLAPTIIRPGAKGIR